MLRSYVVTVCCLHAYSLFICLLFIVCLGSLFNVCLFVFSFDLYLLAFCVTYCDYVINVTFDGDRVVGVCTAITWTHADPDVCGHWSLMLLLIVLIV